MIESGRSKLLDQVRGIAILAVLLRHAWPSYLPQAGVVGVVTFFTLSGFLITGLLQGELSRQGRINLKWFYVKRGIRLLPALLALVSIWVSVQLVSGSDVLAVLKSALISIAYVANLPLGIDPSLGHLWTLATEEQFYLLWPLLLTLAYKKSRVGALLFLLVLFDLILLVASASVAPKVEAIYILPTSWATCLLIGAAAKIYEKRISEFVRTSQLVPPLYLGLFVAAWFIPTAKSDLAMYLLVGPGVAILTALFLVWATKTKYKSFPIPCLLGLGTVSYAAYLWNYPISRFSVVVFGETLGPFAGILLSLLAAAASWFLIESPANRLRVILSSRYANKSESA